MTFNEWLNETGVDGYNLSLGAAFQAGAASRDAEVQRLQFALADSEALELGTAERCDQLRAELVKALAACKVKDEALRELDQLIPVGATIAALAIQPDDSALKAWLGEPVAWMQISVEDGVDTKFPRDHLPEKYNKEWWMFEPLYSPKGLK